MIVFSHRIFGTALRNGLIIAMMLLCGCRAPGSGEIEVDSKVVRYSESGTEAFAEGDSDEAMKSFRKALYRSWAMDDPYHAGTNAYNIAAVYFDREQYSVALDWLVDARVELARAGASSGNVYLLQARIAQAEDRWEDASRLISMASCSPPPCENGGGSDCKCGACQDPLLARVPCVGTKLEEQEALQQCRDDYRAQVHLASARLATEMYDIPLARGHLAAAREISQEVCSDQLRAEIHHAAGMIDLANGLLLEAAAHFDLEARLLRQAGNYRKIPDALRRAATAYQDAGRFDLAADRLCRVARIWFARGDLTKSWDVLQEAIEVSEVESPEFTQVRLKLTAMQIEAAAESTAEQ